jgi:arylsulfatase A-like enzyme
MNAPKLSGLALLLAANLATAATNSPRPNILFIMSDDHAAHAISAYGSKVNQTPQLDRLAKDGARFANAFVCNSICTPSRATLLTGKYSHLNGVPVFNRFDGSQPTVSKMLQAAGYHTGMIGKWHLGSDPTGFDRWIVLPGQGLYNNPVFLTAKGRLNIQGYATDVITDLGIEFLETRPKDKSFFLMLHHKAPHRAWQPDEAHRAQFKDRVIPEPATLNDDYASRPAALPGNEQTVANDMMRSDLKLEPPDGLSPAERTKWLAEKPTEVELTNPDGTKRKLTGKELAKWKYQRYMQDYLACVQSMDDGIGRVLDYLDRTGLATNTVVFYMADNGFFLGDHGLYDKRFMYEPSLRVPLLVRGPGVKRGAGPEGFALNVDLAPTFLDLAGEKIPAEMQGRSLVPLLRGESPAGWRTAMYYRYYHDPGDHNTRAHYGIRTATHKLIHYWKQDAWELFDLKHDPNELRNLAGDPAHAKTLAELKQQLTKLKASLKDEDQFANEQPKEGVGGVPAGTPALGRLTIQQAIEASASKL